MRARTKLGGTPEGQMAGGTPLPASPYPMYPVSNVPVIRNSPCVDTLKISTFNTEVKMLQMLKVLKDVGVKVNSE